MKANYTHYVLILDESGSMAEQRDDTIGGVNRFVDDLDNPRGLDTITVVKFATQVRVIHALRTLKGLRRLTRENYSPCGSTALLDAMGRAIDDTGVALAELPESERPSRVVVMTVTDGHENASRFHTKADVARMVTRQREQYGWEFLFMGADIDSFTEAGQYGIGRGQTMNYDKYQHSNTAFAAAAMAVNRGGLTGQSVSFNDEERASAMGTDAKTKRP